MKVVIGLESEKELPGEGIRRQNEGWGGCKIGTKSEHDTPSNQVDLGAAGTVNRGLTALHLALTSNSSYQTSVQSDNMKVGERGVLTRRDTTEYFEIIANSGACMRALMKQYPRIPE